MFKKDVVCYVLDLGNLQEQVKKAWCFKKCTDLSLLLLNCSSGLQFFANSRPRKFFSVNESADTNSCKVKVFDFQAFNSFKKSVTESAQ